MTDAGIQAINMTSISKLFTKRLNLIGFGSCQTLVFIYDIIISKILGEGGGRGEFLPRG